MMSNRATGKISHWNPDKGFGFITPDTGGKNVFVHVSAFHSRIPPPRLGEVVTFVLSTDQRGRPCAKQVLRDGEQERRSLEPSVKQAHAKQGRNSRPFPAAQPSSKRHQDRREYRRAGKGGSFLLLVAAVALGAYSFYMLQQADEAINAPAMPLTSPTSAPAKKFQCDGRTHCSHVTSCEEAFFFIEHCPGTQMDGDRDGIPCESQWCG